MISNLRSAILMNSKVCAQHNTTSTATGMSSVAFDGEGKATYQGEKKRITFVDFPVENPHVGDSCSTQTSPQENSDCVGSITSNACSASTNAITFSSSRSVSSTANGTTPTPPNTHNDVPQANSLLPRQTEESAGKSIRVKIETIEPIDDTCLSIAMSTAPESRGTHEGHDTSLVHCYQHSKAYGGTSPTLLVSGAHEDDDSTKIDDKHCLGSNQHITHGYTIMMSSGSSSSSSSPSPQPPHGAVPKEKLVAPKRLRTNSKLVTKEDLPHYNACGSERNEGNINNPPAHYDSCHETLRRLCDEHTHAAKSITPSSRKRFATAEHAPEQILPVSMLSSANQTSSHEGDSPVMGRNKFSAAACTTPTPPSKVHKTSPSLKKSSCAGDKSAYVMIPNLFLGAANGQQSSQPLQPPITAVKKEQSEGDDNAEAGRGPPIMDAQAASKAGKGKGYFVPYEHSDSDGTAGPFNDAIQSNPPDTSAVEVAVMLSVSENDHDNPSHRLRDGPQTEDGSSDKTLKADHGKVASEDSNVSVAQLNCTPSQRNTTTKNGETPCPPLVPYYFHQPPMIDTQSMWTTPYGDQMLHAHGGSASLGESRGTASFDTSPRTFHKPLAQSHMPYPHHLPPPQHFHGPFVGGYPPSAYYPYPYPFSQHPSYIPSSSYYHGHHMAPPPPLPRYPIRNENSPVLRETAANTCTIPTQTVAATLILNEVATRTILPQPIKPTAVGVLSVKKEERQSSESGEAAYEHMPNNGDHARNIQADKATANTSKNSAYLPPNSSANLPRAHCSFKPNVSSAAMPSSPTPPPTPIVSAYICQSHTHGTTSSATQAPAAPPTSNSFYASHAIGEPYCPQNGNNHHGKDGEGELVASLRALSDASKILLDAMMNSCTETNKIKSETRLGKSVAVLSLDDDDNDDAASSKQRGGAFNAQTEEQVAIATLFSAIRRFKKVSAGALPSVPCENDDCSEDDDKMNGGASGKRRRCESRILLASSPVSREVQTDIVAIPTPIPPTARRSRKSTSQQPPRTPRVLATSGDRSQTPPLSPSSASRGSQQSSSSHKLGNRFEGDDEDSPVVIGRRYHRTKTTTPKHELLDRRSDRKGRDGKRDSKSTRKRRSKDYDDSDVSSTSSSSSDSEDFSSSDESSSYDSDSDSDSSSRGEERRSRNHSKRRRHKAHEKSERSHRRSYEKKDRKVASNDALKAQSVSQKQRDSKPVEAAKGNEGGVCFDDDPNVPLALMVRRPGETGMQFRARKRASNEYKEQYRLHKARVRAEAKEQNILEQASCQNEGNK